MALSVTNLVGFGAGGSAKSMIGLIQATGLSSGLIYALDAGDINSYDGSSENFNDTSGNGNHYFKGLTSGADAGQPTFTGTANALDESAYFVSPGTSAQFGPQAATTFDDGWSNPGGAVTLVHIFYAVGSIFRPFGGNATSAVGNGSMLWGVNGSEKLGVTYSISNVGQASATMSAATTLSAIQFAALAWDVTATSLTMQINSTQETFTTSAVSASGTPPKSWRINDDGLGDQMRTNDRLYATAAWSTKLTTTQLSSLYTLLKQSRFTSLP